MSFAKTATMSRLSAVAAVLTALLVAACGGSSSSSSHLASAPTTAGVRTMTAPVPTTPVTTSTATTTSTTSPSGGTAHSGAPPCRAADLALSYLGGQGATGHGMLGFALRNTTQQTCSTIGYPGIQFLDKSGQALPTLPMHTTHDFFGSVPETPLTVAPGATVSFRLGVTHGAASPSGCTTAYGLQVIPPNDTATLRTEIPNGAFECRTASVSPLAGSFSAYP